MKVWELVNALSAMHQEATVYSLRYNEECESCTNLKHETCSLEGKAEFEISSVKGDQEAVYLQE